MTVKALETDTSLPLVCPLMRSLFRPAVSLWKWHLESLSSTSDTPRFTRHPPPYRVTARTLSSPPSCSGWNRPPQLPCASSCSCENTRFWHGSQTPFLLPRTNFYPTIKHGPSRAALRKRC